jgi:hypothetical protein
MSTTKVKYNTIESVTKYSFRNNKTLCELLALYPGYGEGFKLFKKGKIEDYYVIEKINLKNNRNSTIFAKFHNKGVANNRLVRIRNTVNSQSWNFEPSVTCKTQNGIKYDIQKIESLINNKKNLLQKRQELLI